MLPSDRETNLMDWGKDCPFLKERDGLLLDRSARVRGNGSRIANDVGAEFPADWKSRAE